MGLPRVLLIGDSIRISYQKIIAALLDGQAEVLFPDHNCLDTRNTLKHLEGYLDAFRPDVVHWNNGLHDIKLGGHRPPRQVPLEEYQENLRAIATRLMAITRGRAAWASSTPVVEAWHNAVRDFTRLNADIDTYNHTAAEVLGPLGLLTTDLHAVVAAGPAERYLLRSDGVHLNDAGRLAVAGAVAATVRQMLSMPCAVQAHQT